MIDFSVSAKLLLSAALLSTLSSLTALAGHASDTDLQKPQISIKTKYVEISLTVDTGLKPFNKRNADTAAEWRDNRKAFRGQQWFYERDYALRSVVDRYISIVRSDDLFEGGAHPNQQIDTILWDNGTRKRTNIRGFFIETTDNGPTMTTLAQLAKLAVARVKLSKDINGYDDDAPAAKDMTPEQELQHDTFIENGIRARVLEVGPVTLAPSTEQDKSSGLTFHYSHYGVGPYVEGPYTVFVSWTAFRQYLSPQGVALFGGDRPKADQEKW
jgi:hypothetical protein